MSLAQAFLAEFEHESSVTRTVLERVPEEKFDWQPHEKSMTLGRLAGHIAENTMWAGAIMDQEVLDFKAPSDMQPMTPETSAELLEFFDKCVAEFSEKIAGYSDEDFMADWTMKNGDDVVGVLPRVAAVRSFIFNHNYHHRGQLTVYLRLLGVPLPMVYGPSADETGGFG